MTQIYNLTQIKSVLGKIQPIQEIEEGFIAYSEGKTEIPPVGEMIFKNPPGDVHIKYGYIGDFLRANNRAAIPVTDCFYFSKRGQGSWLALCWMSVISPM